jgi:predicted metalloprotease
MPAPRRSLVTLAPVAAALIALGCVAAPDSGPAPRGGGEPAVTRTTGEQEGTDPDGTDTPEEFAGDVDDARRLAEEYWAAEFRASGLRFQPVAEVIPYERDGEVTCGGQPLGRNNAAYCSAGDFIAYDVNWAFAAFRQIGDAFIFYLLGHEYAHAVQVRLGVQAQFTIQQELQADCMAGAYIGDLERKNRLSLQEGDTEELAAGIESVGDDPGQPWFAEGSHGTARQRIRAFANGYQDSLEPCNLT